MQKRILAGVLMSVGITISVLIFPFIFNGGGSWSGPSDGYVRPPSDLPALFPSQHDIDTVVWEAGVSNTTAILALIESGYNVEEAVSHLRYCTEVGL